MGLVQRVDERPLDRWPESVHKVVMTTRFDPTIGMATRWQKGRSGNPGGSPDTATSMLAGGVALLGCEGTWRDAHVFHADLRRAEELLLIDARARAAGIGSASRSRPSILLNQAYHSRPGHGTLRNGKP
jgi:hypothetical protein